MAEALSAIATLTTLSLAIIQKTVKFIQETRKVDDLVKKLSDALEDLKSLIEDVQQTCTHVKPTEDDSSQRVKEALDRCVRRLEGVKSLVEDLASRKSGTFIQKASLKIRSDRSKADIQEAIEDIKLLMTQIHQRAGFWSL
jgi:archaellum component FlaC